MSEPILFALIQLFAIVAASRHKELSDKARSIIESYLKKYLRTSELEEYLKLYDELFLFHEMTEDTILWGSEETIKKVEKLCIQINKGLQQKDKLIVFIKFIEFIEEINSEVSVNAFDDIELKYYKTIQRVFSISQNEFDNVGVFLLSNESNSIENFITICSPNSCPEKGNHISRNHLNGKIIVYYSKDTHLIIGKYFGTDNLHLNGHFLSSNQAFIITPGSIIKNQKIQPIYYTDIASKLLNFEKTTHVEFIVNDLGFTFKNSSNGIQPFSFSAESGELIGIIGGSGAGKSTLLSLLNGTIAPNQGGVYINGHELASENDVLKKVIGYIPQDDLLIEELTVFQNLYFNARLCFKDFSKFRIIRIILKILHDIDLLDIRDLVVGSPLKKVISGGQRKRLNIALELLREPNILFADEPTSGLSSMDSEMVILLLKEQTLKGRMVMINIHQPSTDIFKLFDKLLFLDKGGFPIYYGNPIDSLTYFKKESKHVNPNESECLSCGYVNPEQLFQITEAKTINKHGKVTKQRVHNPADWYKLFKSKIQDKLVKPIVKKELPESSFQIPSTFKQFKIFSLRNLLIKLTNRQYILLNLLEAPFLALILAFLTRHSSNEIYFFGENKNIIAFLFMSVVVSLFLGMMVSAEEIIKDRKIMKREAFLTLSRFSYLNSKIFFLIILSAIQALSYVLVGNLVLGIHDMLFSYWLILFSTSCFANFVGLNISSAMNSVVNIYILIPFFLVPQILLSGVIVPFDNLNSSIASKKEVPWVGDLMASRWAFEALAVTQFVDNSYSKHFYTHDKDLSNLSFEMGYKIPALQSMVDDCHRNIHLNKSKKRSLAQLKILKRELNQLEQKTHLNNDSVLRLLSFENLDEEARIATNSYLKDARNYFSIKQRQVYAERDEVFSELAKSIGEQNVLKLKQKNYNESLADWVLDRQGDKKLIVSKKGFVRKKDPIYFEPESKIGRAHFYAPIKKLGNLKISTLWFNIGVLWLMSLVLYLTLWHNSLRKLSEFLQRFFSRKE